MTASRTGFVVLALGLLVGTGPAVAAEQTDAGSERLGRFQRLKLMDVDRDGAVSPEEFARQQSARFVKRDANKDGRLGPDEVEFAGARRSGNPADRADRLIKRYDADADGRVTRDEHESGHKAWFAKRDKDGDGKISADETSRRFARRGGRGEPATLEKVLANASVRFKSFDANGDGAFDAAEIVAQDAARREYRIKRAMKRLDQNGDGTVTPEEFIASANARFGRMDLDSDGRITAEDLPPMARAYWTAP